jgi:fatty-acyl-CoA synthase
VPNNDIKPEAREMSLMPVRDLNIAQVIERHGTNPETQDRTFLMYRDAGGMIQRVSFGEFYRTSLSYGAMIQKIRKDLGQLDAPRFHVAFYMQNTPEAVYLLGGCAFTNSTLVGINNAQVGEKLAADIKTMDVQLLFVDEVEQPKAGCTFMESVLHANRQYSLGDLYPHSIVARRRQKVDHPAEIQTIEECIAQTRGEEFTPVVLDESNAGVIIFTSGTTGAPKGIEVLWRKVHDVGVVSTSLLKYTEKDVGYICMPLNHSNSLYLNLMPALLNGASVLLRRRFSASNFVRDISEVGATVWNSVGDPVMYVLGTVGPDADYAHLPLRVVVSTGTNAVNRAAFTRIFGLDLFAEAYGSTEVGAIAMVTPDTPAYSVGTVLPGKDVRVVDEFTGEACQSAVLDQDGNITNFEKAVGEVVVSQASLGDSAFSGYYNMPDESAERIDDEGYYHMGDLGAIEEKAGKRYVVFLGRTGADRLRNKGENFSATFVEEILLRFPDIRNCAVIGIPYVDSTENDNPLYVLEVEHPARFDLGAFYTSCQGEIPHYALPGYIRLLRELPRTDTHKVKKSGLLFDFIERNAQKDADEHDVLVRVAASGLKEFRTEDFQNEMAHCIDPAVRARFTAVTRRKDIF